MGWECLSAIRLSDSLSPIMLEGDIPSYLVMHMLRIPIVASQDVKWWCMRIYHSAQVRSAYDRHCGHEWWVIYINFGWFVHLIFASFLVLLLPCCCHSPFFQNRAPLAAFFLDAKTKGRTSRLTRSEWRLNEWNLMKCGATRHAWLLHSELGKKTCKQVFKDLWWTP